MAAIVVVDSAASACGLRLASALPRLAICALLRLAAAPAPSAPSALEPSKLTLVPRASRSEVPRPAALLPSAAN